MMTMADHLDCPCVSPAVLEENVLKCVSFTMMIDAVLKGIELAY